MRADDAPECAVVAEAVRRAEQIVLANLSVLCQADKVILVSRGRPLNMCDSRQYLP